MNISYNPKDTVTHCQIASWRRGYYEETYKEDMKNKINDVVDVCHKASTDAGWWTDKEGNSTTLNPMCFAQKLCLIHSEISEAMEGDRKDLMDDKLPHRKMSEVELADAVIRIFDLAGAYSMDLGGAIVEKLAYNAIRPDHKKENREAIGGKAY